LLGAVAMWSFYKYFRTEVDHAWFPRVTFASIKSHI
jgi:hypothetical protein